MSKRLTTDLFITQALKIHKNQYDYSKVEYTDAHTKVLIFCKKHRIEFWQTPNVHKKGVGCPKCGNEKISQKLQLAEEKFFEKCIKTHDGFYDYNHANYKGMSRSILINCPLHGLFEQNASNHLHGKQGCPVCAKNKQGPQVSTNDFIKKSIRVHGNKYDYSDSKYLGIKKKVYIKCDTHGFFLMEAGSHLSGQGCPRCGKESSAKLQRKPLKSFIKEALSIHGDKYDYSRVVYVNTKTHVTIGCPVHGWFEQTPYDHVISGCGCPRCNLSSGEIRIDKYLKNCNLNYQYQYAPVGCAHKGQLKFDFMVNHNGKKYLIEFDGIQHFEPIDFFGGQKFFTEQQKRDSIKNKYAAKHGYELIRISYLDFDNIDIILERVFEKTADVGEHEKRWLAQWQN